MGWPEVDDLSDLDTINAVWRARRYISPDGKRQDAATCYLHPALQNGVSKGIHVVVETQVTRILFDESHTATGVELRPNPVFHPSSSEVGEQQPRTVKAKKLVVATSGAIGTPALLQRSGLGDAEVLGRAGVSPVVELPGVGRGYEDHHLILYGYSSDLGIEDTLDELLHKQGGALTDEVKGRMMGWNAQDIQGKVRPAEEEISALGPEFQKAWDEHYKPFPEKPLACFTLIGGFPGDPSQFPGKPCLALSAFTVYPFSRGHVYITGPKLEDQLDFETGFFEGEGELDIKKHVWLYKKQRELIRRMPSYRGEIPPLHPPFPSTSSAACVSLDAPLSASVGAIEYTTEDDAILEKWIRENVGTTWHSLGTCKMQPQDKMGVVDSSLNVYGVTGLKIADMSIVPSNVAANTNDTALAIGEKAADICIRELGLRK